MQVDMLTVERCGKALKAMADSQEMLRAGVANVFRCSATSAADQLAFGAWLRNKKSGREYELRTLSSEGVRHMSTPRFPAHRPPT